MHLTRRPHRVVGTTAEGWAFEVDWRAGAAAGLCGRGWWVMVQSSLFADAQSSASLSACGRYRYTLTRRWAPGPLLVGCLVNPSTADGSVDDPTVRKFIALAKLLGFAGILIVNLYAWRATDPANLVAAMRRGEDVVGPENDDAIVDAARAAGMVIAGWGPKPWAEDRARHVLRLLAPIADMHCLRRTANGSPEHPLFLPMSLRPQLYQAKIQCAEELRA
jgi:hypothetical protein